MKYNTTIDRMTKAEADTLLAQVRKVAVDLMDARDGIPDGPTVEARDAFISNAKVDIHNAIWELTKAIQHLEFVSQDSE